MHANKVVRVGLGNSLLCRVGRKPLLADKTGFGLVNEDSFLPLDSVI